ncbi:MAG TPA: hypothetical protein VKQ34_03105 [Candidatus Saccharimonadales bacterium]|nr:hypothetical protein [Candidatus Saccharimonadales bacterium]
MEYAYLGSNAISFAVWIFLYWHRKDLRRMMLIMSICAMPLALFDLVFVPAYWKPVTLFHMPVGLEGFLYSFSVGGIAAVIYAELTKRTPRHIRAWRASTKHALWVPVVMFTTFVVAYALKVPNPEIAAYIAVTAGVALTIYLRPDLALHIPYGAVAFGVVYFACLKIWILLFPGAQEWFVFQNMPKLFIWGVPGWEAIFGFFFGASWSNLYEILFGYRLVPVRAPGKFKTERARTRSTDRKRSAK